MNGETDAATAALIERILARDEGAFEIFVKKYERLVFHLIYRMIPSPADQEDLCQDIFIKIYRNLSKFRCECKMSTWIAQIAYNACLNTIRKKKVSLVDDTAVPFRSIYCFPDDARRPDREAESNDMMLRLQEEISGLPLQYRTVLTLFHLEDMSISEIVHVMHLAEGTVKSLLFRARKMLKNRWIQKYKEEICA
jgi:RNA polymerase sigma factor (sigma-70 family)